MTLQDSTNDTLPSLTRLDLQIDAYSNAKGRVFVVKHKTSGLSVENHFLSKAIKEINVKVDLWKQQQTHPEMPEDENPYIYDT